MGSGRAWPWRHHECCGFACVAMVGPTTHAWLWTIESLVDRYDTWCLWIAITWVPTTPTSRTLSLTRSADARLSDLWVTSWQMWHRFHFGGVASCRYFLHNRKCRPCGLHARSLCSQWTSSLPGEHSVWWQRCCFLWLPSCAECSSI